MSLVDFVPYQYFDKGDYDDRSYELPCGAVKADKHAILKLMGERIIIKRD